MLPRTFGRASSQHSIHLVSNGRFSTFLADRWFGRFRGKSGLPAGAPKTTRLTDIVEKGLALIGEQ